MLSEFKNKKVIITGHTGFKGSWLLSWLIKLNANVLGISKNIPTHPSHYQLIKNKKFKNINLDIKYKNKLKKIIKNFKPDFIFHLAAQSLVFRSIEEPFETWHTNLIGTLNVLNAVKSLKKKCSVTLITSDKCYENLEIRRGYKETDRLGGHDPYSASKASTEILIKSYVKTFLNNNSFLRVASVRAGNVIGGGDWSDSRIIPDCVKAWSENKTITIRNPNSTRPWQHVLEPIYGYLILALNLYNSTKYHGHSFNFGPSRRMAKKKVVDVVKIFSKFWKKAKWKIKKSKNKIESNLLSINSQKALTCLKWQTILSTQESLILTAEWYDAYYHQNKNSLTDKQIKYYESKIAKKRFF